MQNLPEKSNLQNIKEIYSIVYDKIAQTFAVLMKSQFLPQFQMDFEQKVLYYFDQVPAHSNKKPGLGFLEIERDPEYFNKEFL